MTISPKIMAMPICELARRNGGVVPLECLFGCTYQCGEKVQQQARERQAEKIYPQQPIQDDFGVIE